MKKQMNMFQTKEDKSSGKKTQNLNRMEISNLPDKVFKVMVIRLLTELGSKINEHSEKFNRERENIRKYQTKVTELKNNRPEKYTPGFKRRLNKVEKRNS